MGGGWKFLLTEIFSLQFVFQKCSCGSETNTFFLIWGGGGGGLECLGRPTPPPGRKTIHFFL